MATFIDRARNIFGQNLATAGTVLRLPEFNLSEKLGNVTGSFGQTLVPKAYVQESVLGSQSPQNYQMYNQPAGPAIPQGQNIGNNASRSAIPSSGQTVTGGTGGNSFNSFNNAITQNRDQNLSIIDSQFNEEMGRLNDLEGRTRTNYASAIQQAQDYYPQFQKQLESEKATDIGAITAQEDQAKMESNRGLARTRQLLSDLQRSQAARMSATGNYSSSVADAFGESFGRKAFDANNQIQSARDQALQQLSQQKQQTENFYSRKSLEAKQSYDQQLNQLQMQLQSQLDAINNARGTASSAKAQATAEAWNSYTNNKLNLDQQILQYQQDLDSWKSQQDSFIQEAVDHSNPNVVQDILGNLRGDSISMAPTTQNTPQSLTEQAMVLASKKPRYLEDQILG